MLTRKNAKASAVLAILFDLFDEDQWKHINVEHYQNGGETGFAVANFAIPTSITRVVFSKNRNSDNIVLYCGIYSDFNMSGNVPNEKTYRNAQYFRYDNYLDCAKAAKKFLLGEK